MYIHISAHWLTFVLLSFEIVAFQVGPKKEKQRYRKGKLVMILKKTITDDNNENNNLDNGSTTKKKDKVRQSLRKSKHSSSSSTYSETSSYSSASQVTQSTSGTSYNDSFQTANTSRTSLGKSVRGPYKSYSEKFLAQQEDEKKRYMMAIMEGKPLDDFGYNGNANAGGEGAPLLLTDGSTQGTVPTTRSGPVDPDADQTLSSTDYSGTTSMSQSYGSGYVSQDCSASAPNLTTTANEDDFKNKSTVTLESQGRRGVYGGGVRYFTPEKSYDEFDDEDETEEEEEDTTTEDEDFSEEEYTDNEGDEETMEVDGSDMGSMFSEEESSASYGYNHANNAGIDSVCGSVEDEKEMSRSRSNKSKGKSSGSGGRGSGRRGMSPPQLAPIRDDSRSSDSR